MTNTYQVGDLVKVQGTFQDATPANVDPDNVEVKYTGGMIAPVDSSGACPPCTALVAKPHSKSSSSTRAMVYLACMK